MKPAILDDIDRLAGERDALAKQLAAERALVEEASRTIVVLVAERDALKADNAKLRHCLEQCVKLLDANALAIALAPGGTTEPTENHHPIVQRARTVLNSTQPAS